MFIRIIGKKMTSFPFLLSNGILLHSPDTPAVSTFLESYPGAYTTTRTHNNATNILFWERHLRRLANSAKFLLTENPKLFFKSKNSAHSLTPPLMWDSVIKLLVDDSMSKLLPLVLRERRDGEEELAITVLVSGDGERVTELILEKSVSEEIFFKGLDVSVHIGSYVPHLFGVRGIGARLAMVGPARDFAQAKYSSWVKMRKSLEKLRPPGMTELLLSNDGDRVLEGCVTNFFVVCCRENDEVNSKNTSPFEVQTAPISDGVLPGIIRQLVIEVCLSKGIPFREVAPSWSKHELWQEAFLTNSLRIIQNVEKIQVPSSWESLEQKNYKEIAWEEMQFGEDPGMITTIIQEEIMKQAGVERFSC